MSDRAKIWALAQDVPDTAPRDVLMALAEKHEDGGLCLPTAELCRLSGRDLFHTVSALWFLRNKNLIRGEGFGGLMSVTLGCDFEDNETAPGSALPQDQEEGIL